MFYAYRARNIQYSVYKNLMGKLLKRLSKT